MNSVFLVWIILAPLLSSLILGLAYLYSIKVRKVQNIFFTSLGLSAPLISFLIGFAFFIDMLSSGEIFTYKAYRWIQVDAYWIDMAFLADHLSIFMVLFITFVGWLIHIYAAGYMRDDDGYGKFFFYFNFFLASMLLLVLADSPIIMFMGWEGVGLCSYFLIGFYYQDKQNVVAANKAFIVNRVGDFGFIVGLVVLFFYGGKYGFDYTSLAVSVSTIPLPVLTFIGVCLFVGAMGKSAQIPLFVWLPDAMAGPTPVSALIHAATMVTAGVYMVARFHFLYDLIPNVGLYIAYIGALSALFAAVIATKQTDIKKILAYSTMSQLGYMFIAVGLGGYDVGIFHVFTHAFFKALLFMGAGALIIALHHEQNIFKMGGMRAHTPVLFFTMLMATLAISGIPPFAGFFSKDEILLVAFAKEEYLLWAIGVFTAVLTSYYMFRLFFVVFYGKNYVQRAQVAQVSTLMKAPLIVLAIGTLLAGFVGIPEVLGGANLLGFWLDDWSDYFIAISHEKELVLMGINVLAGFVGIAIAYKKFYSIDLQNIQESRGIVWNRFYIDSLYDFVFVQGLKKLSIFISMKIDIYVIDAIVMGVSRGFIKTGHFISKIQTANIRLYAFIMLSGISMFSLYLVILLR